MNWFRVVVAVLSSVESLLVVVILRLLNQEVMQKGELHLVFMVLVMFLVLVVRHTDFFVVLTMVTSISMRVFKASVNCMFMEVHWLDILLVIKLVIKLRMDFSFLVMLMMLHLVMRLCNVVL